MKNVKYLIVQPHSDDALFSVAHLLFSDKDVAILTVENNGKRVEEDRKLYEFLGKPYQHLKVEFDDQSFYGFYKQYKSLNPTNCVEYLTNYFGEEKLKEIKEALKDYLTKFLSKNDNVRIFTPWGIGHPFHMFVSTIVGKFAKKAKIFYYRDFPHSYKQRAKEQVKEQLVDYELYKSYPVTEIADIKWDLAKRFYKSQSGLLWFEQNYIKKNLPEEVYVKKS